MPRDDVPGEEPEWVETWKEHASAFDRVKSITMTVSEPRPVSWIAEEAAVSPNTAEAILHRLDDLGIVVVTGEGKHRHYHPDPSYIRLQDIQELLEETTEKELSEQLAELENDITAWKAKYDADSPDELHDRAAADDVSAEQEYELTQTASKWELTLYRLSLIREAIDNYDNWTSDPSSITR